MKLYSWNVNGLRAVMKKNLFEPFIAEHQPDILCLQETKADRSQVEIDLPHYYECWNSATKKGYSGTAIFSKNKPLSVEIDIPDDIADKFKLSDHYGNTLHEGRVLVAEFEQFYVASVYTPNAKDDLSRISLRQQWDQALLEYVQRLAKLKPIFVCGDLNVAHSEIDLARPKENSGKKGFTDEERRGFQAFIDSGFVDSFRMFTQGSGHYTWWSYWANARSRNIGWRIDYILASQQLQRRIKTALIHPDIIGSDHCPVSISLND